MVVTRKKLLYYMLVELQSLVNVLFQNLESTEEDPSKVQECKVESLISKLGASSHTSESQYDSKHSRAASRMSCGHASPEEHKHPFTAGSGVKLE